MIDAYCHCGISKYRPVEDVLGAIRKAGVERAVLCQHLGEYDNGYLAAIVDRYPGCFAAVCLIDSASPDWRSELRQLHAAGSFAGLRVTADTLLENFALPAEAVALGLTLVVYSPEGIPRVLAPIRRLTAEQPDATVVITHLGCPRVEDDRVATGWELIELAAQHRVFVTLSGQSMFCEYPYMALDGLVAELIGSYGADRVMWGSNYPVCGSSRAYQRDLALITPGRWGLDRRGVRQITSETAERLWFARNDPSEP